MLSQISTEPSHGATYNVYASNNPSEGATFTCSGGSNDVCNLHCDEKEEKDPNTFTFNCGSAGTCNFYCSANDCMGNGILNGQNANNLNVIASGDNCTTTSTVIHQIMVMQH